MNVYDWIRGRILDAEASFYRWRVRREIAKRAKVARERHDAPTWFIIAMLAMQTIHLGALTSCAARQARGTIADVDAECAESYDSATTREEVLAVHARCDERYDRVRAPKTKGDSDGQ